MMTAIEHAFGSLTPLLQEYGVTAVMIIVMLESIGLPLPGESVLILASVLAARGDLSFPFLLVFAWAGAVLGDNIGYVIGRTFGRAVLLRVGGRIGLKADRVRKVEDVFARYGSVTVGFARFFPILRQLNGVVAGTLGMEWPRFLLFNALGGALWVLVWSLLGFYLGAHVGDIAELAHDFGMVGAAVAAAVVAAVAWLKWRRRRQHLQAQSGTILMHRFESCGPSQPVRCAIRKFKSRLIIWLKQVERGHADLGRATETSNAAWRRTKTD